MLIRFPVWAAGLAGFLAVGDAPGQSVFINDTNTAILLWVPEQANPGRPAFLSPAARAGVLSAERSGIGLGVQGYGTALSPQADQPGFPPQANQPTIGQQGSAIIPSLTNQFVPALPTNTPPMLPQATNGSVASQASAGFQTSAGFWSWYPTERVWVWTPFTATQSGPNQGGNMSIQPGGTDQNGRTSPQQPQTAVRPVPNFPPLPPGRPPLVPRPGPFPGSGTAVGGPQGSPGSGQGSGTGSSGSAGGGK